MALVASEIFAGDMFAVAAAQQTRSSTDIVAGAAIRLICSSPHWRVGCFSAGEVSVAIRV